MRISNVKFLFFGTLVLEIFIFLRLGQFNQLVPFWNDNINITLPNRVFLDNALTGRKFPYYDYLSGAGVPFLSIYTSSGISPITLLVATLFNYSVNTLILEVLFLNVIAFTGMYFWIKKVANYYIALLASTAFVFTSYFVGQSTANIEALGTTAGLPWVFLGLANVYHQKQVGIFQLAAGLGLAFTHGYLGLNILISVLVLIGICFYSIEKIFTLYRQNESLNALNFMNRGKYLTFSIFIFLGTILLLITETLSNYQKSMFFNRNINPFTASMKFESWKTIFDPLIVRNQPPDVYGGFYSNLYVALPFLFGFLVFFTFKQRYRLSSFLFFAISYCSLLPENYAVSKFLVEILPGFDSIRFHSWATNLIVFLILSLGSVGLSNLCSRTFSVQEKIAIFISFAFLVVMQFLISRTVKFFLISLGCLLVTGALIYISRKSRRNQKSISSFTFICLLLVVIGQMVLSDRRIGDSGTPYSREEQILISEIAKSGLAEWPVKDLKRQGVFSVLGQYPNELVANQHMYFNVPVAVSYTPQMNPRVLDANIGRGLRTLEPLLVDTKFIPLNYVADYINPNEVVFKLTDNLNQEVIIQFTYSKNFKVYVNGISKEINPTAENFISLKLSAGEEIISLRYQPPLAKIQFMILVLSWLIIGFGLIASRNRINSYS